ncbi:MAG TPA: NADPH:quinone oxidoreductase family protein, partial [Nevskia sp.]|nr:NADPH:quinone oxidoreductase family protein [Nevskia sp.]
AIKGAGVNFPDTLIIQGKYQMKAAPPFTPGAEVAGTVLAVGDKVKHVKVGDPVAAIVPVGAYAEQVVASGDSVMPLPPSMDLVVAAGFPLVYGTTLYALKQRGQLKPGETLLVLGAAGGVGLAAVQVGKLMGARVIAAASSAEKLELCRQQGADEVIDYSKESLKEAVKKLTRSQGADVIYDPVGGELAQDCLSAINWNGRYLVIGFAAGGIPEIATNRLLLKGASAVGVFWGAFIAREPKVSYENFQQLFGWISSGQLKPYISKTYPMSQAGQALRDMQERKVTGKIVLVNS